MAVVTSARWLTWANVLTSLRLFAALPLFHAITTGAWGLAFALFWLAVASDWGDGRVARARGESSALGGVFDHASDAIFVVSGLSALVASGQVPWPLPLLVATAFLQYVLDSKALAGWPLRASVLGRWNGILYFVPIGFVVTSETFAVALHVDVWILAFGWALVLSTLLSMTDRGLALVKSRRAGARPSS